MSPMITRRKDEDDTIRQYAFTMTSRRARWTHEFNTKTHLREAFREFFDMPKILAPLTKLLQEPEKVYRRPNGGLRCPHEWPDAFTIRAKFEYFYHRVSILCKLRDSVTPALVTRDLTLPIRSGMSSNRTARHVCKKSSIERRRHFNQLSTCK